MEKYPFIQTGEVRAAPKHITCYSKMYGDFGLQQSKLWPKGTLCITIAANIAETAFLGIDACFPDSVVGFTPYEHILPEYVRHFIESQKQRLWAFAPATAQSSAAEYFEESVWRRVIIMDNEQYSQYFVAFSDILGFKNLVNNPKVSCADILKIYKYLGQYSDMFFGENFKDIKDSIKIKIMSDSICIYVDTNAPNALYELVMFCTLFQYNLLVIDSCVFIRGGIACGDTYVKDDTMFGPALTEAYLLEKNNTRVPRIIMCKSTLDRGKMEANKISQESPDVWTFRDDDAFYTLNYFTLLSGKVLERVSVMVSNWLDVTTNESIRQKYLYLEKHIRQRLEEKTNA